MAVTLTKNLKLRIDSNLTANSQYNLNRIDLLGSTFLVDTTNTLNIRSQTDINIEPNSADVGGSGVGGNITLGTANHKLASLAINTASLVINGPLSLQDQATGGTTSLALQYKSDINGSVDSANRTLSIDLDGSDRNLVLGGSLIITGGDVTLNLSGATSVTLPTSGTLSTLSGAETLTNKTIAASSNNISGIANANISNTAAIAYSKLALSASILGSDISASAAIPYSTLNLSGSIVNSDLSPAAAISYSKLVLSNSIQNSDIASGAGIGYAKLTLNGSILDSDISSEANISRGKLAPATPNTAVYNDGSGNLQAIAALPVSLGGTGVAGTATYPSSGTVLSNSNTAVLTNKTISGSNNTLNNISYSSLILAGSIVNSDISNSAAITYSKLALRGGIVDSDVSPTAAIQGTKIVPTFGNQKIITDIGLEVQTGGYKTLLTAATGGQTQDLTFQLPNNTGTNGQVLTTNGTSTLSWATISGTGTVTSVDFSAPGEFSVSGNPITTAGTITLAKVNQTANTVWAGPTSGPSAQPSFRALTPADLPSNIVIQATGIWAQADGTSKIINHGLNTSAVDVTIIDLSDNSILYVNSIIITDSNNVTLTSSEAPSASGWKVIVQGR